MPGPVGTLEALEARDNLMSIVNRWDELTARLHGGGGNAITGMPRHRETRLPINVYVSDLMREIEDEARTLAHTLIDELHGYTPYTQDMPGLLRDVAIHHGHWTGGDDVRTALDFTDWAHQYAGKVRGVIEMPPPAQYLGDCPVDECYGDLYLTAGRGAATCPDCRTVTTVADQLAYVADRMEERLMTASEIMTALTVLDLAVPRSTLYRWAGGRELPVIVDMGDEPHLYRLADALWLAKRRKGERAA